MARVRVFVRTVITLMPVLVFWVLSMFVFVGVAVRVLVGMSMTMVVGMPQPGVLVGVYMAMLMDMVVFVVVFVRALHVFSPFNTLHRQTADSSPLE